MGKTHLDISTQPNFGNCPILNWMHFLPTYFVILRTATKQTHQKQNSHNRKNTRLLFALQGRSVEPLTNQQPKHSEAQPKTTHAADRPNASREEKVQQQHRHSILSPTGLEHPIFFSLLHDDLALGQMSNIGLHTTLQ